MQKRLLKDEEVLISSAQETDDTDLRRIRANQMRVTVIKTTRGRMNNSVPLRIMKSSKFGELKSENF